MKELGNKAGGAGGNRGALESAGGHPKNWVVRMVQGRSLAVPEKTLYWWSVHLEMFLKCCQEAGPGSNEIPEAAVRFFLESLPVGDFSAGLCEGAYVGQVSRLTSNDLYQ